MREQSGQALPAGPASVPVPVPSEDQPISQDAGAPVSQAAEVRIGEPGTDTTQRSKRAGRRKAGEQPETMVATTEEGSQRPAKKSRGKAANAAEVAGSSA
jgi:hypothetical protein